MLNFSFYRNPFVFLTTYYCIGLFLGTNYFHWEYALISSLLTLLFVLFDWNFRDYLGDFISKLTIPCMLISLGYWSIHLSEGKSNSALSFSNTPVTIEFSIEELEESSANSTRGIGLIHQIQANDEPINVQEKVMFYIDSSSSFKIGDRLIATSYLHEIENKGNPGEFNQEQFWRNKGVLYSTFIHAQDLKWIDYDAPSSFDQKILNLHTYLSDVIKEYLSGQELALAQALILGDKSLLNQETKSAFSSTGAMHVLAVSGMHIALILQILLYIASFFYRFISRKNATLFIVLLLWIYAILTGFSPSVIRAVFTFSMLAIAQLSGNNYRPINILFFSALVLLILEPLFLYDIGFQLSYLAMIGIYLTYEQIASWFTPRNRVLDFFWKGTSIGFAAQVMTIPLMLYYFHQFPNYFILSNLILLVLSGVILGAGITLFITWKIPLVGQLNAFILFVSLWLSLVSLHWIEGLPGAVAYGFHFPFFIVPLLTLSAYFLILYVPFSRVWMLSSLLFAILLSWIVLLRFDNMSSHHLVIFNHSKLTFALKNGEQIHCFVDTSPQEISKAKFMLDAYTKCYPGNIEWHAIKGLNGSFILGNDTITWQTKEDEKVIQWNRKNIPIQYSATHKSDGNSIYMPWIEHPKSLKYGAIIYDKEDFARK